MSSQADPITQPPLPDPAHSALFLDVDGTLLELAAHPDAVIVSDELKALLGRLLDALGGALALISGRELATLDRLFSPLVMPAAGIHGLERRSGDGGLQRPVPAADWREAILAPLQRFCAVHSGLALEDKGHALALHFRRAPEQGAAALAVAEELIETLPAPTRLLRGKMVIEFMPAGADKGQAIREFMAESPFRGRQPVFIGDDVTDEAGFAAVNHLDGLSVHVGRDTLTAARHRLDDVASVHAWLAAIPGREAARP
ncbi:MAG: trehalose-phosphatase [Chromatiales bacterium]|nr:trehalose-phosphatase [Chromatiales bacterium]